MPVNQRRLETDGVYETRAPISAIVEDFARIEGILDALAARKKRLVRTGGIMLVAGIVGFFASRVIEFFVVKPASLMFVVAGIALLIVGGTTGRGVLKNRMRSTLARELLKLFQDDADPKGKLSVRLLLKGAAEVIRQEDWSARKKGKQTFSRDRFLNLEAELLDGTVVSEEIEELARKRTYVNPRGKSKTKIRNRYLATLQFAYPRDLYGDVQRAQERIKAPIRVPSSARLRGVRVNEKSVKVKTLITSERDIAQACAMSALGAYRILNLSRRMSNSSGGAS